MFEAGGRQTVAEGVECAEQASLLAELGCSLAQGYHFGRPLTPAEFEAWMAARPGAVPVQAAPSIPPSQPLQPALTSAPVQAPATIV